MKKSRTILAFLTACALPGVSQAECKKHIELADTATLKAMVGKDGSAVTLDSQQMPMVSVFDKVPASGKGKVVGHVPAGKNLLFLDRKEGAFQIESVDASSKAKVVGWVDKKFTGGKPVWLDTTTFKACEGEGKGEGKQGGGQKAAGKGKKKQHAES